MIQNSSFDKNTEKTENPEKNSLIDTQGFMDKIKGEISKVNDRINKNEQKSDKTFSNLSEEVEKMKR